MKKGFTLLELLIVVLIIGILAAVALPQYQKAVMKSRFSALMPVAKNIANGNEAYYLEHGTYATSPDSLDIAGQEEYPDGTELDMSAGDYSFVLAGRSNNFPMNYIVYQNHSTKFAGNIHCEADENNTMAQEVCQSLGGELIGGSQTDGFLTYVLSGAVGTDDKLPTSINKLKAQICGNQFDDEHCIVDEVAQTVTTKECGNSISYNANGVPTTGAGCVTTTYGADGTPKGQAATTCNATLATYADGKCVPKVWSDNNPYETTYNEEGFLVSATYCHSYSAFLRGCSQIENRIYNESGASSISRRCGSDELINLDTKTCRTYDTAEDYVYDRQGRTIDQGSCDRTTVNSASECLNYQYMRHTTYGETDNDWTRASCTAMTGTSCTGTWINEAKRKSTGSNTWTQIVCSTTPTAQGECPTGWKMTTSSYISQNCTNGVNWETATCL